ncbi:MAG: hypothetical protein K8S99_07440 [Planctomycetes bacterium]|nr:hypothetical protein [Planctomycetota bacterium]
MESKPPTARDIERRLLEKRVETLERRHNRLLVLLALIVLAFGGVIGWGWSELRPKPIIGAEEFRLIDSAGSARAWLSLRDDTPELVLFDKDKTQRIVMSVSRKDGPFLRFNDEASKKRISMSVDRDGPVIGLSDEAEVSRALFRLTPDRPSVAFNDAAGKQRADLYVDTRGAGLVFTTDAGKTLLEIDGLRSGPQILMKDEQGNFLWTAPR